MCATKAGNYRFLLGGYDLEMQTIRDLLLGHGYRVEDRGLEWGAKLSAYAGLFNPADHFVGIELIEDVARPPQYTAIDHHNENSNRPSALEQIAELLHIELNHYQQLVAANDRGYIPEMEKMGATRQEINDIRKADRRAQGVTDEDERLGIQSVKFYTVMLPCGIKEVNALTPRFSVITDGLYPVKNILVVRENYFVYFGQHIDRISSHFQLLIDQSKAFYGGGADGFFGLTKDGFSLDEMLQIKNDLINFITKIL